MQDQTREHHHGHRVLVGLAVVKAHRAAPIMRGTRSTNTHAQCPPHTAGSTHQTSSPATLQEISTGKSQAWCAPSQLRRPQGVSCAEWTALVVQFSVDFNTTNSVRHGQHLWCTLWWWTTQHQQHAGQNQSDVQSTLQRTDIDLSLIHI